MGWIVKLDKCCVYPDVPAGVGRGSVWQCDECLSEWEWLGGSVWTAHRTASDDVLFRCQDRVMALLEEGLTRRHDIADRLSKAQKRVLSDALGTLQVQGKVVHLSTGYVLGGALAAPCAPGN